MVITRDGLVERGVRVGGAEDEEEKLLRITKEVQPFKIISSSMDRSRWIGECETRIDENMSRTTYNLRPLMGVGYMQRHNHFVSCQVLSLSTIIVDERKQHSNLNSVANRLEEIYYDNKAREDQFELKIR